MREEDTDPGMTTRAITAEAGTFRVRCLRGGFVELRRLAAHRALARVLPGLRHHGPHVGGVPGQRRRGVLFSFLFDLYRTRRRFSAADLALVGGALRGLKWFHRNLMLSHGLLVAGDPLSPTQRRALALLLTDRTEKETAAELSLTPGTVHQMPSSSTASSA
jgi:hypothetical protein